MSDKQFEPEIGSALLRELINENRSAKRWKNIRFFFGFFIFIALMTALFINNDYTTLGPSTNKNYVNLVRLDGMIEAGRDFSAEHVLPILKDAFSDTEAKGVVLDINSGGGTPVQASIIHDAIVDLKKKYHKKVIVVGEDVMASGAYYVAVAADKIYVNPNTVTGSIGVIMKGFGFTDLIKKAGVERRVYTSGINKDRLDPFLPQNKDDSQKVRSVIEEIHANFSQIVMEGRKGKLHGDPKQLFSGDFWSGQGALKLGLVDELGNLPDVLQKEFHVVRFKEFSTEHNFIKSALSQMGMSLDAMLSKYDVKVLEQI